MVYIAPTASNGAGPVWVKISEEGYSGGKWAVDNLKANGGKHSFIVPAALAAGEYLVRPEIIASHEVSCPLASAPESRVGNTDLYNPNLLKLTVLLL